MLLPAGTRLGSYEILAALGAGGMGEVYRARDTTLSRDVAIKVLPDQVAHDAERLARFTREAQTLASLNHPHIAAIYGLEESGGVRALVMELVDGEDLSQRIARGAIPVDEALAIAKQIAEALETAHDKGIVHRDLKPANIKITPDQRIKVLDFGIAKAIGAASSDDVATLMVDPTRAGVVVGTPAYMSPEQARGEAVGVQADIWAFGAVLYEMLTGTSLFGRKTEAETVASVLESQPDYTALPLATPPLARRVVERCLEKNLSRRMRDIGDVRILLDDALASSDHDAPAARAARGSRRAAWIAAGVAAGTFAVAVLWLTSTRSGNEKRSAPIHVVVPFLERAGTFPFGQRPLAISADGSTIALAGVNRLGIRRLDQK